MFSRSVAMIGETRIEVNSTLNQVYRGNSALALRMFEGDSRLC